MARRASSSPHPLWVLLTVALLLGSAGLGYFIYGRVSDPWRTIAVLPVRDYLDNANSLRGNSYKIEGTVAQALEYSARAGRLFSVETTGGDMVALLVPPELSSLNLERGQKFLFRIEVAEKGILRVQDAHKV